MVLSFENKTVVVTGASKGIGKGIAQAFAGAGASVAVVSRHREEAECSAAEIVAGGGKAYAFEGDVTSLESMKQLAKKVNGSFGGIDIICANAGIFPSASLEDISGAEWDAVMNTNVKGTFFTVQASLPYLKRSDGGRIIMTSSITGPLTGYAGWSHYGASKAAQLGFMRSAALELAPHGITINAIMPGNVMTEGLRDMGEAYLNSMAASVPLKRLGTIDDMAHAALFFASEGAGYITGQTLVVDGGGQTIPESLDAFGKEKITEQ
ncbi:3-oxoacyl-ACP reductase FabG [Terrilactibacillus sp. S3-3]|nr:3-oxoacyl-ACP reductase FabG [Terrilactibacillus sp. S3-3]